jgi:arsenic resistance protein ArsH
VTASDREAPGENDLPALRREALPEIEPDDYARPGDPRHKPRILLLYGSLRERSYSRLLSEEAGRLLRYLGCGTRTFSPDGLPLPDAGYDGGEPSDHPKVAELRDLATWSEGMMWVSPERHGAMTGVMKAQIDWLPLSLGGVRPTQGKTLALAQVSGGSQSFNTLNQMRVLGRWMRMVTIPNQSSVPKAFTEFDGAGRMKPSPYYMRLVDVCEELVRFTWMVRGRSDMLTDRYSERVESAAEVSERVNQRSI